MTIGLVQSETRKLSSIEDRGPTDRVPNWDGEIPTLTLTSDLNPQSRENHGHDPYTCKRSMSKVTRFKILEWKLTDRRTEAIALPPVLIISVLVKIIKEDREWTSEEYIARVAGRPGGLMTYSAAIRSRQRRQESGLLATRQQLLTSTCWSHWWDTRTASSPSGRYFTDRYESFCRQTSRRQVRPIT